MGLIKEFDLSKNFWSLNLQHKVLFNEVYHLDKGKARSSKWMWAIAFMIEPYEAGNLMGNIPLEIRKEKIKQKLLNTDKAFKWKDPRIIEAMATYKESILSEAERSVATWENRLREREHFISSKPYNEENIEKLDKYILAVPALIKNLNAAKEELQLEQNKVDFSKKKKSLSDSGDI